jgi:NAD(P)-dependent dehydrogenase (short-subunit alcohol dehydrogenase family)
MTISTRSIFITGGSSGLGEGLALAYLDKGYQVGIASRSKEKFKTSELAGKDNVHYYEVDVIDRENLIAAVDDFVRKVGGLGVMVANAGVGNPGKEPKPDWNLVYRMGKINFDGVLYSMEACFDHFERQQQGHLVLMSSLAGYIGVPGNFMYSATKAALMKMTESLAIDWLPFGIHTTCVTPGFIDTPLTQKNRHRMPFLMDRDRAVEIMVRDIEKKKVFSGMPWQTYWSVRLIAKIPRSLYVGLMRLFKVKL